MIREIEIIRPWAEVTLREVAARPVAQLYVANYALATLAQAQAVNRVSLGYLPAVVTRVDGRLATATLLALAAVKVLSGVIEFTFERKGEEDILRWIAATLARNSPHGASGRYERSHLTLADDVPFDVKGPIPAASEYVFISSVPYARKIERGASSQAPDGVYQAAATLARNRFPGRPVSITFEYRALASGGIGRWSTTPSARRRAANTRGGNTASQDRWLQRQPAIVVRGR